MSLGHTLYCKLLLEKLNVRVHHSPRDVFSLIIGKALGVLSLSVSQVLENKRKKKNIQKSGANPCDNAPTINHVG